MLSRDGLTFAVGAYSEDSLVNSQDNLAINSGAVYVFTRLATIWRQQTFLKATTVAAGDFFGSSLALNADGSVLAVGAMYENSSSTGINAAVNKLAQFSGAAYIFTRNISTWLQQAYVKAKYVTARDNFGKGISLSDDGNTLAVGAKKENSNSTGVNSQANQLALEAGAVFLY